jgi:leucyl aminopeptidase
VLNVTFAAQRPDGAYALAIPVRGEDMLHERLAGLGESARTLAMRAAEGQRFERELASVAELYAEEDGRVRRLLLAGLGTKADEDATYERAGAALVARLLTSGETRLVVDVSGLDLPGAAAARIGYGAVARAWRHDKYRTKLSRKQKPSLEEVVIVGAGEAAEAAWPRLSAVLAGIALTRDLVAEPANVIYPESFVARCREEMEPLGIEIDVLDEARMGELGMNALLGVSLGSERPAQLLVMRWNGGASGARPVALIGKGVTFDTGGISIKPAQGMEAMKWDMGGAGAVAGAMKAIAGRKAKANVVGICGLVENMPDGRAQRPGDIVTSMSGQTIEVINTDAEGRLVLCDALTFAQREYRPEAIVDLATLTGAMIISLGHEYAGMFANDDGLAQQLEAAGKASGDRLWRLPMNEAYDKIMDSPIADMRNSAGREAGSITAACFLGRFIEEGVKWAHLDIAGMVWADKPGALWDKGATGFGVALLDRFVADNYEG